MRWGADSASGASFRWVRPLRSILCTLGDEHEEPEVVRFEVGGITSSNVTFGHRFLSDGRAITVKRLDDYLSKLEAAKVIADPERRRVRSCMRRGSSASRRGWNSSRTRGSPPRSPASSNAACR